MQQLGFRWRHGLVVTLLAIGFVLIGLRLLQLSVFEQAFLQHQSELRIMREVEIPAHRGKITDRNHVPLAISTPLKSVWVNPQILVIGPKQLKQLGALLEMSTATLQHRIHGKANREFVYLKRRISPELAERIQAMGIEGIFFQTEYKRFYPDGDAVAHVLGFTNVDDRGQEGIELAYEAALRGESGKMRVMKDRLGQQIAKAEMLTPPKPGKDLTLSIDHRLQFLAYQELVNGIARSHAKSGSVVVLDPHTGEVLAMANYPSYNPNTYRVAANDGRYRNRAVTDSFEPGSTMKAFSVASALANDPKITPQTKINTHPGRLVLNGNLIHDEHIDHGVISVRDIMRVSSNIGIAKLSLSLPSSILLDTLQRFGFGQVTASKFPGEVPGSVPSYFHNKFEVATLSFGYGTAVTALQLAQAYAGIANLGLQMPISLLKREREPAGHRVISVQVAGQMLDILHAVLEQHGTGHRARVAGYRVAGKTGTANIAGRHGYQHDKYIASFAGIAPLEHPRYVVVVVVREPDHAHHFGGVSAAPIFSKVMGGALRLASVPLRRGLMQKAA